MQKLLQLNLQCQEIMHYTAGHCQVLKLFYYYFSMKCFVLVDIL